MITKIRGCFTRSGKPVIQVFTWKVKEIKFFESRDIPPNSDQLLVASRQLNLFLKFTLNK